MTAFDLLTGLSISSVAVPVFSSVVRFSTLNKELRVLFLYLIISVLAEVISVLLRAQNHSNILIQNLYTISECSLLSYIYLQRFADKQSRLLIKLGFLLFVALATTVFCLVGNYNKPDNLVSSYESCFFITLSWSYYYKVIKGKNISDMDQNYFAWINSAILIYFSMALFSFLFNKFSGQLEMNLYVWVYTPHLVTNVAYNILLAIGIWKIK